MKFLTAFTAFMIVFMALPINATEQGTASFDMKAFAEIPVMQDGRVKPMESFARAYLLSFSGKTSLDGMPALNWLAEMLFNSQNAYQRAVFNVPGPDLAEAAGLDWRQDHYYSFIELSKGLDGVHDTVKAIEAIDEANRTREQQQLWQLYTKVKAYGVISDSFSLIEPHFKIKNEALANDLHLPEGEDLTFLDMLPHEAEILRHVDALKGANPENLSDEDKEWISIAEEYESLPLHEQSDLFRIIPPQWQAEGEVWTSPWANVVEGHSAPQTAIYLDMWKKLADAYHKNDNKSWTSLSKGIERMSYSLAGSHASKSKLKLEVFYLQADLFTKALAAYFLCFVLLLAGYLVNRRFLYKAATITILAGILMHFTGLLMRIIIMGRPPVSTLYETTIFVSLIAIILALLFERTRRDMIGMMVGASVGTVLLFISMRYAAEGDTMEMLVAVLNTNFWLATHVVMITMGYGCSLIAGTLGHAYLIQSCLGVKRNKRDRLMNMMLAAGLIAAFFSMFGTILGGIWADQSWGRFWGWDPKENGAMLIVLWLLWVLHGNIAKVLSPLNFAICISLTNVIVAISWFGVNLLGVGLHSYGFTNNIAFNLLAFCAAEILCLAGLRIYAALKSQKRSQA